MQDLVFLVVVADMDFGAEPDRSCVRVGKSDQYLEKSGFAGTVVSDQCDFFASSYLQIEVVEQGIFKCL